MNNNKSYYESELYVIKIALKISFKLIEIQNIKYLN